MARVDRILVGVLLVTLLLAALNLVRPWRGRVAAKDRARLPERSLDPDPGPDLLAFRGLLQGLRSAPEALDPEQQRAAEALAERLCAHFDRCDVREVLAYYLRLTPEERRQGTTEEERYEALVARVQAAHRESLDPEAWAPLREELLAALRILALRAREAADFVPAARALSLSARLEMERIQWLVQQRGGPAESFRELAEQEARDALALFERAGFVRPRLEPLWVLACLDLAHDESDHARRGFDECLALARRVGDLEYQEKALAGMIRLAEDAGDVDEARRRIDELAQFRTPKDSWPLARWHAQHLLQRDEPHSSIAFLRAHRPEDPREVMAWRLQIVSAGLRAGDLALAREELAQVAENVETARDLRLYRADIALRQGAAFEVIEEIGRPEFLDALSPARRADADSLIGEAFVLLGRPEAAVGPLEHALELGRTWQARLEAQRDASVSATSVLGERIGLHTVVLLAGSRAQIGEPLEAARVIEVHQSPMLRSSVRTAADESDELSQDDVTAWARAFELGLVTWVVGADASVVARVAADGSAHAERIDIGRRALEDGVRRLREALVADDAPAIARLAREIREKILPEAVFAPLAQYVGGAQGARGRLLCLLHGPLEALPIELVLESEIAGGHIVPLALPGLPERAPGAGVESGDLADWSLLGSPVDSAGTPRLPGARDEIAALARLRGARAQVAAEFDRPALAAALARRAPLHVATHLARRAQQHGRFGDLGLELSGGDVFAAEEIVDARAALPLAVLAACETAAGRFIDAEGMQGVARAFLEAGTRNLLVTLWPIEDQAALQFSLEFHRALIAGEKPSHAAAVARGELRARGFPWADWAGFRLVGRD